MNEEVKLPFGVDIDNGTLRHISETLSGLECNCKCPQCETRLVARKGAIVAHHFAHHDSHTCGGAFESGLHLFAKEIIDRKKRLMVPGKRETDKRQELKLDTVALETKIGDVRPDLVVTVRGKPLLVEIFVTHAVSAEKEDKIRQAGVSCLEIDLSGFRDWTDPNKIEDVILREASRYWRVNLKQEEYQRLEKERLEREALARQRKAEEELRIERARAAREKEWRRQAELRDLETLFEDLNTAKIAEFVRPNDKTNAARRKVQRRGFDRFLTTPAWSCQFLFAPEYWQSAILCGCFLKDPCQNVRGLSVWEWVRNNGFVRERFKFVSNEDAHFLRLAHFHDYESPFEIVSNYVAFVKGEGPINGSLREQ